jgi:hypothetical protein
MDRRPNPADVPESLLEVIRQHWDWLCRQWDAKYPDNPVLSQDDDDDDEHDSPHAT